MHTSFVLTKTQIEYNPDEIIEIVKFAKDSGCKSIRFWMYRPMGINADINEVVTAEMPAYKNFYNDASSQFGKFILWPSGITTNGIRKKRCRQLWQHVGLNALGEVGICCGIDTSLPLSEANIFNTPSDDIYNHRIITSLRERLLTKNGNIPPECVNCNMLEDPGW